MRVRKFLKVTAITVAILAIVLLFLVAFFLFNPFEGSLPAIRDVVPRGVDFYAHKIRLREDFTLANGQVDVTRFPYVPALDEVGKTAAWQKLKGRRGGWYQGTGIQQNLATLRKEYVKMRKDMSFVDLVDDILGTEVQVAGYFGPAGWEGSKWCMYTRVTWRGKAAYGAMAQSMVRDEMSNQGIVVGDDEKGGFYTLRIQQSNLDLFVARIQDCLMVSNDRELIAESIALAEGSKETEPLGTSAHFVDGVSEPLQEWSERTGVPLSEVAPLEWHLRPDQLFPKLREWQNWPNPNIDENRNEKILASFVNIPSYRFLSGSVIFEPNSLTMLSHLVVNNTVLTDFQKKLFDTEATPRKKWMNEFFGMVPHSACGAAALKMPAGDFIREMFKDGLVADDRSEINRAIRAARKYNGMEDIINKIGVYLQPRVGVILQPNRRSDEMKKEFTVHNPSPFPQAAWVFWVKKHRKSERVMNDALRELIDHFNENRRAFGVNQAFKLSLSKAGVQSDVAYEFAIPFIPGTGQLAMATVGEFFIISNSGPMIHAMATARSSNISRRQQQDFEEFVNEMPPAINGAVFVWADQLKKVADDFEQFGRTSSGPMDAAWALANRGKVERQIFRQQRWKQYGTIARIPAAEKPAFTDEVNRELTRQWGDRRAEMVLAKADTLKQFQDLCGAFRSAYLQMVLTDTSLRVWGRVLSPEYQR